MNLRTSTIQLFLMTAATAASSASAFVLPSTTFRPTRPSTIAISSPTGIASRPSNLHQTSLGLFGYSEEAEHVKLLNDLDDLLSAADAAERAKSDDGESGIKILEKIADILEHLDSPDSTYLEDEPLTEAPVSRKSVLMHVANDVADSEKGDLSAVMDVTKDGLARDDYTPDKKSSTLRDGANLIRSLIKAYAIEPITGEIGYATYPRHPEFPGVDLSAMMKMMDGPPPLEYFFSLDKFKRLFKRVVLLNAGLNMTNNRVDRASAENMFEEFFTDIYPLVPGIPKPKHLLKHWEDDKELARQMLCGVNPVMIEVAKDLAQLSDNVAAHFGVKELQELINEKRLFFVSYDAIKELKVKTHQARPAPKNPPPQDDPRSFYAPIAVFALDKDREELDIMGIQLERTDDAKVYTKSDGNDWLFAKIHLSSTDSNYHEWVSHLGKTHLTMEPHILAIHNTLKKKDHKLYTFLEPLCKDTLFLNWAARKTLAGFGADSFGDRQSSIGVGQFMQLNKNWWSTYNFFESSGLPSELASRGFDEDFNMPPYLFREDGMRLWNAYGEFATDFVNELYTSDADIHNDEDVQAWAEETCAFDRAAVPGFPAAIKNKNTLVKILQTLMWISGGLHAAVNFGQYDFYAYAPNKPLGMRAQLPISSREDIFKNALPVKANAKEVIQTTRILTLPSETCIDNIEGNFSEVGKKSYSKFQSKLDVIGADIEERNKKSEKAGKAIYCYLNPSVVPASIDI